MGEKMEISLKLVSKLIIVICILSQSFFMVPSTDGYENSSIIKTAQIPHFIQTVDSIGLVGTYSQITKDSLGNPIISYVDHSLGKLKLAKWDGNEWKIEILDPTNRTEGPHSLSVNPQGYPSISYCKMSSTPYTLNLASYNGSSWKIENIDHTTENWNYIESSMQYDNFGNPHIVYSLNTTLVKYAYWNGSIWIKKTLDRNGSKPILTIGKDNLLRICFYDSNNSCIKYGIKNGEAWKFQTIMNNVATSRATTWLSMDLDSNNYPHILYTKMVANSWDSYVKYIKWNGSNWIDETVDSDTDSGFNYHSLKMDKNDIPHVTYHKWNPNYDDLMYGTKINGNWSVKSLDSNGIVGEFSSLTIAEYSEYSVLHISYYDDTNSALKYVKISPTIPSSPINLRTHSGDNFINILWHPPISDGGFQIVAYNIYRGNESGILSLIASVNSTECNYNDTTLTYGQEYFYKISACNIIGESGLSNEIKVFLISKPSLPLNFTCVSGDSFIKLNWNEPAFNGGSTIRHYNIYRGERDSHPKKIRSVDDDIFYYNDTTVVNGVNYTYYISAVNMVGESSPSNSIGCTSYGLPSPPSNIQYISGNQFANITWIPPNYDGGSKINGYKIYRKLENVNYVCLDFTIFSWYNDTNLINGINYQYYITALNIIGESFDSNIISLIPQTTPTSPQNLSIISGDGCVTLKWSPPISDGGSKIVQYIIIRTNLKNNQKIEHSISHTDFLFKDTSVENGKEYMYSVIARNGVGNGKKSPNITVVPIGQPTSPKNLYGYSSNSTVTLYWEMPTYDGGNNISTFHIERGTNKDEMQTKYSISALYMQFIDINVTNGVTYFYRVIADNNNYVSFPSKIIRIIPSTIPSNPRNFTYTRGNGDINLSWEKPIFNGGSELIYYNLYESENHSEYRLIAKINIDLKRYYISSITVGIPYRYMLKAVNIIGESEGSISNHVTPLKHPSNPKNIQFKIIDEVVFFSWNAPDDLGGANEVGYKIYRKNIEEDYYQLICETDNLSYIDTMIEIGYTYHYKISSFNEIGESNPLEIEIEVPKKDKNDVLTVFVIVAIGFLIVMLILLISVGKYFQKDLLLKFLDIKGKIYKTHSKK